MAIRSRAAEGVLEETPIGALGRGIAAGLVATLALSALSRVVPGVWNQRSNGAGKGKDKPALPEDPQDPQQVREWQAQSQSPAAFKPRVQSGEAGGSAGPPGMTPAG